MLKYLLKRILKGLFTIFVSVSLVFLLVRCMPSNPADVLVDPMLGPEAAEGMREALGLNDPVPVQYVKYFKALLHGDFGNSFRNGQPVMKTILPRLKWTLILLVIVQVITVGIGVPVGITAARKKNKLFDKVSNAFIISAISIFIPFLSFAFLYIFTYKLNWLPSGGAYTPPVRQGLVFVLDVGRHAILPAMTLALSNMAQVTLYTRNSAIDALQEDYVRTAYAKGWDSGYIMRRHVLKNAMIPTVTVIGLNIGRMASGAIMTETVFAWPGIGRLIAESVSMLDYPMLQGSFLILAAMVVVLSIVTDIIIMLMDPRIRLSA